jgi:hypothetical protein
MYFSSSSRMTNDAAPASTMQETVEWIPMGPGKPAGDLAVFDGDVERLR